jgi:uncharacterized protein (TIGR02001 family)
MKSSSIARAGLCLSLLAAHALAHAADEAAPADAPSRAAFTAHVDLVSRYVLRGVTRTYGNGAPLGNAGADAPESDRPALQWGADYVHRSGFYAGYWGSQINYSYAQLGRSWADRGITDFQRDKSIENDLYAGYSGTLGNVGYTGGLTYYHYLHGHGSNAFETKLGLTLGAVAFSAQTLLRDVVWGNRGDTYWTAVYTQALPKDVTFTANLGLYTYGKEGRYFGTTDTLTGQACGSGEAFVVNGCYAGRAPVSGGFRHLILGLSQPITATTLTWGLQAIVAGQNRFGVKQGNRLIASLSYGF